jgi:hypothetical protein
MSGLLTIMVEDIDLRKLDLGRSSRKARAHAYDKRLAIR